MHPWHLWLRGCTAFLWVWYFGFAFLTQSGVRQTWLSLAPCIIFRDIWVQELTATEGRGHSAPFQSICTCSLAMSIFHPQNLFIDLWYLLKKRWLIVGNFVAFSQVPQRLAYPRFSCPMFSVVQSSGSSKLSGSKQCVMLGNCLASQFWSRAFSLVVTFAMCSHVVFMSLCSLIEIWNVSLFFHKIDNVFILRLHEC